MSEPSPFALKPDRAVPRWGLLGLSGIAILAAVAYLSLSRSPGITLTAREDPSSLERGYLVDVRATSSAERIYVPRLGVRATLREGRGQFRIGPQDLAEAGGPLLYVLREPWYRADRRGKVVIAGLPAAPAANSDSTEAPGDLLERASAVPGSSPASDRPAAQGTNGRPAPANAPTGASPDTTATAPESDLAPPDAPAADDEAPPSPPRSAWARDRALESELAGRGAAGVTILRKGRSIRLRGTVASDQALRTVYQFMNDKGFGEVDYGVEVR